MPSAAAIRIQIESTLSKRVPAALTPIQRHARPVQLLGLPAVDELVGGFPVGAITELTGPESSGRTSLTLAFLARITRQGGVCAWIDASDTLDGETAAAAGIDLTRLLWIRCGAQAGYADNERVGYNFAVPEEFMVPRAPKRGLHGGGFGPHPRTEMKGLSGAIGELFPRQPRPEEAAPVVPSRFGLPQTVSGSLPKAPSKPWGRIEQALKATGWILQACGFSAVVLDLASLEPEYVSRVKASDWFLFRASVERSQSSLVLLTKHPCTKSAGELLLRLSPGKARLDEATVFTGVENELEIERRRFTDNIVTLKKLPHSMHTAWTTQPSWTVNR
jgi:recombination protein RecA